MVDISKLQDYADWLIEADLAHIDALGKDADLLSKECSEVLRKTIDGGSDA